MTSLNTVILIGRIGKDPVPHIFPDGTTIIGMSLATGDKWKDKGTQEWKESTDWHSISVQNPHFVEYVTNRCGKGDLVQVDGELKYRKRIKSDGTETTIAEIVIKYKGSVLLLSKGSDTPRSIVEPVAYDKRKAAMQQTKIEAQLDDDDVPF